MIFFLIIKILNAVLKIVKMISHNFFKLERKRKLDNILMIKRK